MSTTEANLREPVVSTEESARLQDRWREVQARFVEDGPHGVPAAVGSTP